MINCYFPFLKLCRKFLLNFLQLFTRFIGIVFDLCFMELLNFIWHSFSLVFFFIVEVSCFSILQVFFGYIFFDIFFCHIMNVCYFNLIIRMSKKNLKYTLKNSLCKTTIWTFDLTILGNDWVTDNKIVKLKIKIVEK